MNDVNTPEHQRNNPKSEAVVVSPAAGKKGPSQSRGMSYWSAPIGLIEMRFDRMHKQS